VILPEPFIDVTESNLRVERKVCIVAPGPNGRGHYHRIPPDFQTITVSKAVLIPELTPAIWIMTHSDQLWFLDANRHFKGVRLFSLDAAVRVASAIQETSDCYCFVPPSDSFLDPQFRQPHDRLIRYGGTVSGCAIQFAHIYGAAEILLCGVDLSGDEYFDGTLNPNAHHGDTWPAVERLQPLLDHLIDAEGLTIATISQTRLRVPKYGD
jgi:hypothetical protein